MYHAAYVKTANELWPGSEMNYILAEDVGAFYILINNYIPGAMLLRINTTTFPLWLTNNNL